MPRIYTETTDKTQGRLDPSPCKSVSLTINLSQNNVDRADDRDHVRDHFTFSHHRQRRQVHKTRPAKITAARLCPPIRSHETTELAFRPLDRVKTLARRHIKTF